MEPTSDSIRERLAAALPQALKERDEIGVAAIRSAIGAIEARQQELPESDLFAIVLAEATEREAEAADCRQSGRPEAADRLAAEAAYLREFTV